MTNIGDYAFFNCESLTSINIPNGATDIGSSAFSGCTGLTSITIPDGTSKIEGWLFYGCINLTNITIPDSVTDIGKSAFSHCTNLTSINIPANVISIGADAFSETAWITERYLENPLVTVNNILIDGSICEGNVSIPDGITSIGDYAFYECTNLTSINIPDGVTSIGNRAFCRCESLTDVTIPDGMISIGSYAFSECKSLKSIDIPDSVKIIETHAFSGSSIVDTSSENIYFNGSKEQWNKLGGAYAFDLMGKIISFNDGTFVEEPPLDISLTEEGTYSVHRYFGDNEEGLVIVPDEIDGIPVTDIPAYGFWWSGSGSSNYFSTIILGKNIKNIDHMAFINPSKVLVDSKNPYFCTKNDVLFTSDMTELIFFPYDYRKKEYTVPDTVKTIRPFAFSEARFETLNIISKKIRLESMSFYGSNISVINIQGENIVLEGWAFQDNYNLIKLIINGNITYDIIPLTGKEITAIDIFKYGGNNCDIFGTKNSDAENLAKITERPFYETGSEYDYKLYKEYNYIAALYKDHAEFIALRYWDYESDEDLCIPEEIEGLPVTSVRTNAFNNSIYFGNVLPESIHYPKCIEYIGDLPYWFDHLVIENPNCIIGEIPHYDESDNSNAVVYCPDNSKIKNTFVDAGYTVVPIYKYPGIIKGDANLDGQVNIADIVILQKWLLCISDELTCWQNVDLCKDKRIDVFDMILMKKLISERSEVNE